MEGAADMADLSFEGRARAGRVPSLTTSSDRTRAFVHIARTWSARPNVTKRYAARARRRRSAASASANAAPIAALPRAGDTGIVRQPHPPASNFVSGAATGASHESVFAVFVVAP